ncbi:MAG: family 10 glycosylhydrolase [Oscillatoria sp. PMC 1068.18]|nr:family 10 glycosylhydrolase [Oscillatoria sp. PMC 1076.18]MEC4987442.1 family 10 glycosylhydrolase [Oscillatoria sp. PMC 1068.18]
MKNLSNTFADSLVYFSRCYGRKAWLVFLLIFSFTLTVFFPLTAYPQTTQLKDIQGNWAQTCIQQLAQERIISGYPDGTFRPNSPVSRAEFAAMIGNAFANASVVRSGGSFRDVASNYWAANAIRQAYQTNFLTGYPQQIFRPTENIPRVQALVALASGLGYTPSQSVAETLSQNYFDANAIPDYATSAIAAATEKQLVVNYPNVKQLQPTQLATRGEIAAFICQALGKNNLIAAQYIPGTQVTPVVNSELRGVWLTNIDSDVLFSKNQITDAVKRLDDLNFNTLYPTVWNDGYTLYPSQVAESVIGRKVHPEAGLQSRDFLKEIIAAGHAKNMAVIPWFEFGFMAPAESQLAKRHPEWLTKRENGSTVWLEGGRIERVWLNPLNPEVQQFITNLLVEIVTNYDLDGIQLDDHFGFPYDFGYDNYTINLYRQEHAGKNPPSDAKNIEWIRWRADKVTEYMKQVFAAVKDSQPTALISVSPNPQEYSLEYFLLDWEKWERLGLIEELIVQVYRDDYDRFVRELNQPEMEAARLHIPVGVGILSGLKGRNVPFSQIEKQVETVRDKGFAGVSFFFYESLWNYTSETPTVRQAAIKEMFAPEADRPNILTGWKPS